MLGALLYKPRLRWCAQVLGAVLGALLEVALVPGLHWGRHSGAPVPGCFPPPPPTLNNFQILGWTTCAHALHACWFMNACHVWVLSSLCSTKVPDMACVRQACHFPAGVRPLRGGGGAAWSRQHWTTVAGVGNLCHHFCW